MANRVQLIREKNFIQWRYVRTNDNTAGIGSIGETSEHSMIQWLNGPNWLSHRLHWPDEISIIPSEESEKRAKLAKVVLVVSVIEENQLDALLSEFSFWKTIRVTAFALRYPFETPLISPIFSPIIHKKYCYFPSIHDHSKQFL